MTKKYVVALDQGTTSSRAILFNKEARIVGLAQQDFEQMYPAPGWVEHDPREILSSQLSVLNTVLISHDVDPTEIDCIGITNQRETTIVWDRETGQPIYNAIVWQCRRTAPIVEELCSDPAVAARIRATTGLIPDAYFSASKIKWILDTVEGARAAAEAGTLCFGTVDTWLLWSLTSGNTFATDYTNASRTMLFDIHEKRWDPWLCELFDIPMAMLPEVQPSSHFYGHTSHPGVFSEVPITGVAGDQQAALFGQCCFRAGEAKNTYGTGCFLLMHTGYEACCSKNNLVTTIAASSQEAQGLEYAMEGSVFTAGALLQWLRDGLGLIDDVAESEFLAQSVSDTEGVYVVPAFTGLGAPYWDAEARGALYGLTRGTKKAHVVRAALEALAYQVSDLVRAMEADAGKEMKLLNVDGGAARNNFLMQFQSDALGIDLLRPETTESTAKGAAFLAGLKTGFWKNKDELSALCVADQLFSPQMKDEERQLCLRGWHEAVARTRSNLDLSQKRYDHL